MKMNFDNFISGKRAFTMLFLLLFVSVCSSLTAQLKEGDVVDKIAAVVGNEVIMLSDLTSQIAMLAQQDPTVNVADTSIRSRVLNSMINEKLVVAKAIEDSVVVSDDEIKQRWEYQLNRFIQYYGSEKRIEDIYGMSIARLQYEYKDDIRKQLLSEKLRAQKFQEVKVTPREVEDFYKAFKDTLPSVPAQVELYHIVKNVEADSKAKDQVLELAKKVRDSLMKGGDFADFAKRYSQDPGTAASGGDLGWFEKGKLFPEFEKSAFALQVSQFSVPVETPFGFHIIQTLDKNKDSVLTRHILFKVGQSTTDVDSIKSFLNSIKQRVEKGESFEELAKKYSDEKETQGFGGALGKFPIAQIPATIKETIDKLQDGQVSEPYPYSSEPKVSFHIMYRKKTSQEHKPTIEHDYKEIEQVATNYKQNKLYQEWVEQLRKQMYWEIKL